MQTSFKVGQVVHVDTDHPDWGRVAEDATILEIHDNDWLLVNAHVMRANILVPISDVGRIVTDVNNEE